MAPETALFVSAVVAWEYSDLRMRKRVSAPESIESLQEGLGFELLDLPAAIWADLETLPVLHRDPMDRMLVSHARLAGLVLVTADATIRRYPVQTLW
jgi:PIN domain nuclease of toxin-antitoxin system